eukprot:7380852-Prymnesium_polylepis.2
MCMRGARPATGGAAQDVCRASRGGRARIRGGRRLRRSGRSSSARAAAGHAAVPLLVVPAAAPPDRDERLAAAVHTHVQHVARAAGAALLPSRAAARRRGVARAAGVRAGAVRRPRIEPPLSAPHTPR